MSPEPPETEQQPVQPTLVLALLATASGVVTPGPNGEPVPDPKEEDQ